MYKCNNTFKEESVAEFNLRIHLGGRTWAVLTILLDIWELVVYQWNRRWASENDMWKWEE